MIRRCAAFIALVACSAPARPVPEAACGLAAVDTAGWHPLTSRHRTFAITLPSGAADVRLPCIDSPCGQITVGAMVISYDSGPMAGPGARLTQLTGTVIDHACRVRTADGRSFRVGLGRYTSTAPMWGPTVGPPDTIPAGTVVAQAALPVAEGAGGLYLYMRTPHPADQARFVSALRTVRVLRTN